MQRPPEQDADLPRLQIGGGDRVSEWLRQAARSLGVTVDRTASSSIVPGAEPRLDGPFHAVHVVRSPHGQVVTYPVAREWFEADALRDVVAPAPGMSATRSAALQQRAIAYVSEAGILGAACLRFGPDQMGIPDLTVGVDGSAAWTLDGATTPLYENHVRALLDLPLGTPNLRARAVACCVVRGAPGMFGALRHCMARDPGVRVHLEDSPRESGTTVGHVSVVSDDADDCLRRARHAADYLTGTILE